MISRDLKGAVQFVTNKYLYMGNKPIHFWDKNGFEFFDHKKVTLVLFQEGPIQDSGHSLGQYYPFYSERDHFAQHLSENFLFF